MNYLQFDFETVDPTQGEILLALLVDAGFEGFEEGDGHLKAFIKETAFKRTELDDILRSVPVRFVQTVIPPENWNEKWERGFEPVRVNDFAAIRANFHEPIRDVKHEIIITPKMSFGTGHHATTFLMMEQMAGLNLSGKRVLDFGTGTGVLAILAEKMGATEIMAIDNDEWSINNSTENALANACSRITIQLSETLPADRSFNIILANINLTIILANLSTIAGIAMKGTRVLLSGFLETDGAVMKDALLQTGFNVLHISQKGEWLCMDVKRV